MPKIPREVIDSVLYLYPSREAAEAGTQFGGTGFIVAIESGIPGYIYPYAVTNWHVAVRGGASVIRVNKIGGGVDIFEFEPHDWIFNPGGYDLAIVRLSLSSDLHNVVVLNESMLISEKEVSELQVGPGEDIFMIGRFVDHDGAETNVPAARFGHISIMPQPIKQPTGSLLPSFILDVHSRTGYSGSPVFVYRTATSDLSRQMQDIAITGPQFLRLLAVHWDQFPEMWEIGRGQGNHEIIELSDDARYVRGMSGMTLAVPAWAIKELLDLPQLKDVREEDTRQEISRRYHQNALPLVGEAAVPTAPPGDANPDHLEDFTRLVGAASKRKPQAD
jgi:hypothetical protein